MCCCVHNLICRHPEARPVYTAIERTLQRRRRDRQPPIPNTIDQFVQSITLRPFYKKNKRGTEEFYAGRIDYNGQCAIVFFESSHTSSAY